MDKNSAETGKWEHELVGANGTPATERRRPELDDSLDFFFDGTEQIEESIRRTGLRSGLDEAFRAAIERSKRSPRRKSNAERAVTSRFSWK